ncbi:hypothetical protein B9Z65_3918 [Elsinoe australis]|uniref:Zf-C3HC-domain-containing protein n=1 Tax=Elsinoe australis TaxID=40998 RepID=A0A2P8A2Y2_9PEZI|nr:hypothetical protein B9Z65_3918 [Elsinoe australis]
MPESLATTKRKFYKFLDQLSTPSSPNPGPSTSNRPHSLAAPTTSSPRPLSRLNPSALPVRPGQDQSQSHPRPSSSASLRPTSSHAAASRPVSSSSSRPASRNSLRPSSSSNASLDSYRARLNPHAVSGVGVRSATVRRVEAGGRPMSMQVRPRSMMPPSAGVGGKKRGVDGGAKEGEWTGGEGEGEGEKRPHFTPWSHEDFLGRLRTFAPVTQWFPKPEGVGEMEWARRGWECVGVETVGCRGCKKRVLVDFSPSRYAEGRAKRRRIEDGGDEEGVFGTARVESVEWLEQEEKEQSEEEDEEEFENSFEAALVAKYAEIIVDGHSESCLWRKTGCKDDIYRLPVVRTAWWQNEVRSSFSSVMAIEQDIKNARMKNIDATPSAERILRDLPASFFSAEATRPNTATSAKSQTSQEPDSTETTTEDPELRRRALTIALTGWHASTEASTNLLVCAACFQRIGLWMYQIPPNERTSHSTKAANSSNTTSSPHPDNTTTQPQDPEDDVSTIDLIEMHREHCPYRNATSQAATGDYKAQPAWQILWNVVGRYADEQRRRSGGRYSLASLSRPASVALSDGAEVSGDGKENDGEVKAYDREEVMRQDKERITKLRRLKSVLGIKFRMPAGVGRENEKRKEVQQGEGQG